MQRTKIVVGGALACVLGVVTASANPLPSLPGGSGSGGIGGVITTVTDTAGGAAGTVTGTVGGIIDGLLDSPDSGDSDLPPDTVGDLIDTLLGGGAASGGGGTPGTSGGSTSGETTTGGGSPSGGSATGSGGSSSGGSSTAGTAGDTTAPQLTFTFVNRLKRAARSGKLKLRITSSEPGVVGFKVALRPGRARHVHKRALKVSHKLFKTKMTLLAYRQAGKLTVGIKLPKKSRRSLANARNARVVLQAWATDLSRNQARKNVKRTIKR